eukprot:1831531-Lingulodinium_polyedra.AAC.1
MPNHPQQRDRGVDLVPRAGRAGMFAPVRSACWRCGCGYRGSVLTSRFARRLRPAPPLWPRVRGS